MRILIAVIFSLAAQAAWALNVVATTASMGMLAREVGGAAVKVDVLAAPDRDPHMLQAKPSMMRALRDADLVVAVGAELEMGWLPAAINGAANPRLLPGRDGYFEAAAQVPLLDAGQAADRAHGDVHPAGNPHVNLDPQRMAQIARALAERMSKLEPAQQARSAPAPSASPPRWNNAYPAGRRKRPAVRAASVPQGRQLPVRAARPADPRLYRTGAGRAAHRQPSEQPDRQIEGPARRHPASRLSTGAGAATAGVQARLENRRGAAGAGQGC
jgi:hypothetical protein